MSILAAIRTRAAAAAWPESAVWEGPFGFRWRPDANRDSILLTGLAVGMVAASRSVFNPIDATAYWQAGTSPRLYPEHWNEVANGYLFYPPPVAQVSALLQPLGWPVFVTLLMVAIFGSVWYCLRRWAWPALAMGIPWYLDLGPRELAVFLEYALLGNLQWVLAAVTILALRRPSLWGVLLLTKVTTAVGWWWYVARGEWRSALVAAAMSVAIVALSLVAAPNVWFEFARFVAANGAMTDPPIPTFPMPVGVRVVTAVMLVIWGARTNRGWTVPVAAGWALPALYGLGFLPFWAAALVAHRDGRLSFGEERPRPRRARASVASH